MPDSRMPKQTKSFELYRRSRVFHAHIAIKLKQDPEPVIARVQKNIEMMFSSNLSDEANATLKAWQRAITYPLDELIKIMVSDTTTGDRMRKYSPWMGVLTPTERSKTLRRLIAKEHEAKWHRTKNKGFA
jgi:hypothetical protein